jgi:hypothetical protein
LKENGKKNWEIIRLSGILLLFTLFAIFGILNFLSQRMQLILIVSILGFSISLLYMFLFSSALKQQIKYLSIIGLLVILPFQNSINLLLGFSIRPLTLGLPIFFLIDDLIVFLISKRRAIRKPYNFEVVTIGLIVLAISYLPASASAGSLIGGIYSFIFQFQGIFTYFVIRNLSLKEDQSKKLLVIMLISLVIMVGYGIVEFLWAQYSHIDWLVAHSNHPFVQDQANLISGYYRAAQTGPASYRSQSFELEFISFGYSGYVLSSLLLAVLVLAPRWRKKPWMWVALVLAVLGLASSVTISAIGVFFLSFCIVGFNGLLHRGNAKFVWVLLPVLAVGGLVVTYMLSPQLATPILQRLENLSLSSRHAVHIRFNQFYLEKVKPFLFFGRGTGTSGPGSTKFFPFGEYGYFVENEYLSNITEWGILGLLVYLLFMFSLGWHILRKKRQYRYGTLGHALGIGLLSVFIGYVLIGFYHNVWGQSSIDVQFLTLLALWTRGSKLFKSGLANLGHKQSEEYRSSG